MKREREKQQRKEAQMMGQVQPRGKMQRKNQKNFQYRRYDRQQVKSTIVTFEVFKDMYFSSIAPLSIMGA